MENDMIEKVRHACAILMTLAEGKILMLSSFRFIAMNLENGAVGDLYAADVDNDMTISEFIEMCREVKEL